MFAFFKGKKGKAKEETFDPVYQRQIVANYNLLAEAFAQVNLPLKALNDEGVCGGLTINFLLFAKEQRKVEFFNYLSFLNTLNPENIQEIVKQYEKRGDKFSIPFGDGVISFKRLLNFLKSIDDTQNLQTFKIIRANWDKTNLLYGHRKELTRELEELKMQDGDLKYVSNGFHAFAIEKTAEGYYLFEPNHIRTDLLVNESILADVILINSEQFFDADNKFAFNIVSISFGDEHRELDDLLSRFEKELVEFDLENPDRPLSPLIKEYKRGAISRAELALALYAKLNEKEFPVDLLEFNTLLLTKYLIDNKILDEQNEIDRLIKLDPTYVTGSAYKRNITNLYLAINENQLTLAQKLLQNGADIQKAKIRKTGVTALYLAAQNGYTEMLALLLAHGANPNEAIKDGRTPLLMAILNKEEASALLLLQKGANPNKAEKEKGVTPFFLAAELGALDIVKKALNHHANVNKADHKGFTPLYMAVQNNHEEVVNLLLKKGASPNLKSYENNLFPLIAATLNGNINIASALLDKGAQINDVAQVPTEILTDHAQRVGRLTAIHSVMDLNSKNIAMTPLQFAAFIGHTDLVKLLLEKGASIRQETEGSTALDFAVAMDNKDIVSLLQPRPSARPH